MKIKITKETKNELEIILKGENHTFCNLLRKKLLEDKDVEVAAYTIDHPIVGEPRLYVRGKSPKQSLLKAAKNIKENFNEFKKILES